MMASMPPMVFEKKTASLVKACLVERYSKRPVGMIDDFYIV